MTPREIDLLRAPAALSECTGEQVPRVSSHPAKPTGLATEAQYCRLRFGSAVRSSGMRGCPTRSPSRTASMFRPASARTGDAPAAAPFEACAIAVKAPPFTISIARLVSGEGLSVPLQSTVSILRRQTGDLLAGRCRSHGAATTLRSPRHFSFDRVSRPSAGAPRETVRGWPGS